MNRKRIVNKKRRLLKEILKCKYFLSLKALAVKSFKEIIHLYCIFLSIFLIKKFLYKYTRRKGDIFMTKVQPKQGDSSLTIGKPVEKEQALPPDETLSTAPKNLSTNTNSIFEPLKTTPLNEWMKKCARSIIGVNEEGKPIYGNSVAPFDIAGKQYRAAKKKGNESKANEIFKDKALVIAEADIGLYDTSGDKAIDPSEQSIRDLSEFEHENIGVPVPEDIKNQLDEMSKNANEFVDIDGKGTITDDEYAALLFAMDVNKDGKLSRKEYDDATTHFTKPSTAEALAFRQQIIDCHEKLFKSSSVK